MSNQQIKPFRLSKTIISIVSLLFLSGISFSQESTVDYFQWRTCEETEEDSDRLALLVITPAYISRFYENYLPWWQADILALSTLTLWEVKDGLIPKEKQKIIGGGGFSEEDLKLGALGICLNRVLPVIVGEVADRIGLPRRERLGLTFDTKSYPKLAWSIKF